MAEKPLNVYNMGVEGVNVDVDDDHLQDGELRAAQNLQIDPAGGLGGIRRRDGMTSFSTLSGALTGMIGLPLPDRSQLTRRFYAAMDDDDAGRWRVSSDGTTWADHGSGGMEHPRQTTDWAGLGAGSLDIILGAARYVALNNKIYYAGGDYTQGTTLPTIHVWDGTSDYQISEIPINPEDPTNIPETVTSMAVYDDQFIIVGCWDGGTAGGRAFLMDTTTGAMTKLGPETELGTTPGGFPMCFAVYQGEIYCGIVNGSGASVTQILRCRPSDATWTTDYTTSSATGYVAGLQVFLGKLYAGLIADVGSAGLIVERDSLGTWTTVETSGSTDPANGYGSFGLSSDKLTMFVYYATISGPGAVPILSILSTTDGATYATAYDAEAILGVGYSRMGNQILDSNGDIYFVFPNDATSKIVKRTAAGVFSVVDTDLLTGQIVSIKF